MQDYRKLVVRQKSHKLALNVYATSAYLHEPKAWPLKDQMLRAAISIASNIAEGCGRSSNPDLRRFLWHSVGSCNELEYDLLLARDLNFLPRTSHGPLAEQVVEVRRMLTAFIQRTNSVEARRSNSN